MLGNSPEHCSISFLQKVIVVTSSLHPDEKKLTAEQKLQKTFLKNFRVRIFVIN